MATNEEVEAAKAGREDIVIRDGIRYRAKDAAKLDQAADTTETADADTATADTEKKTRTTAANKARTAGEGDKG